MWVGPDILFYSSAMVCLWSSYWEVLMDIQCECCNSYKSNFEVKMYGKWLCNNCKYEEKQKQSMAMSILNDYLTKGTRHPDEALVRLKELLTIMWSE